MLERMIRAARLDVDLYEMVEADSSYTKEAFFVVLLTAIATAIGSALAYGSGGIISGLVSGILGWVIWSAITLWIGTNITRGPQTQSDMGEMLRTLGYAHAPGVLKILVFIPVLGPVLALVGSLWQLIAGIVAIRQALDFTTGRAIGTVAIGWVAVLIISVILTLAMGGAGALTGGGS